MFPDNENYKLLSSVDYAVHKWKYDIKYLTSDILERTEINAKKFRM